MSNKYYSYSSSIIYSNNGQKSVEEEIVLNNNKGHIIRKKNGKVVKDKKITKKEFKEYLDKNNLFLDDNVINNALITFNNILLPTLVDIPINKYNKDTSIKSRNKKEKNKSKLKTLLTKQAGLSKKEIKYIDNNLNKKDLISFMTRRYNVEKAIFRDMTKKQILKDLIHSTKNSTGQKGGYYDSTGEPQPGFSGNISNLQPKTLDFNFPEIIKNNNI
tara:strand:+ start:6 stop:656 length:651 start_codon:yes stop_codon:yes gene_type:complete